MNNAGGTVTEAGTVIKIQNVVSATAGSMTNTVVPLSIVQSSLSAGVPISITQDRVTTTNFRKILSETNTTNSIWVSNGTNPNGSLSGIS